MKKKSSLLLVVVLIMLQVLTGCSLGKAPSGDDMTGVGSGEGVLKLGIVAKGYGDEWLSEVAKAYQKKSGVETVIVKSSPMETAVRSLLTAGEKHNDIDVIFDIWNVAQGALATQNYVPGYERAFAPLSDIYDKVVEGYDGKTLEEITTAYALDASTWGGEEEGFGDGEQYFVSYVSAMQGLIYNADLFDKYNLEVPKTTNQMFDLMDKMKTLDNGTYPKNDDGMTIYPYTYSGLVNYAIQPSVAWWAQYDGLETFLLTQQGKDASGQYTAESAKTPGRLSAMQIASKLLAQDSGYTSQVAYSMSFTDVQVTFLDEQAFMMSTGDWLEREMAGNFDKGVNVQFMRIPINSDIIMVCDSIETEEQLVEVIKYIDGDTKTRPTYLSDTDLERLVEARSIYSSEANQHIAYVPVYSDMIEEAKDFLLFLMSKEGQEIMMKYCNGNTAPLNVDFTSFDEYKNLSSLQRSKHDMVSSKTGIYYVGNSYTHPMTYAGGLRTWYDNPTLEAAFGVIKTSASYMTAEELWLHDYNTVLEGFENAKKIAGVSGQ